MEQYKPLTLRRNFSWTFIGNAVYAGSQWGMLVVLAKLGSPEMVGQFTLGLAVTAPVIMFTNLQLRSVQATDAKKEYLFSDYLGLRLLGTGLALLIFAVISFSGKYRWDISLIIFLLGWARIFDSISDVFQGLLQSHERMDRIAISGMIKGPLSLLLMGIGVYIFGSVVWGAVGLVFASVLILVTYDVPTALSILKNIPNTLHTKVDYESNWARMLQPRWQMKKLCNLALLALPMGFVMMLFSLNVNIPRYFIEEYLNERALGIFAAIAQLMMVGNIIVNALGQSAMPRLAKYYAAGDKIAFRTLLFKLVGIGGFLGAFAILISMVGGQQILSLLYGSDYAQQSGLLVWLMVAGMINYISYLLGDAMTAARYFHIQMPLLLSVTTTSTIVCFWLIPIIGLQGAALAQIFAAIVQIGFSLVVLFYKKLI